MRSPSGPFRTPCWFPGSYQVAFLHEILVGFSFPQIDRDCLLICRVAGFLFSPLSPHDTFGESPPACLLLPCRPPSMEGTAPLDLSNGFRCTPMVLFFFSPLLQVFLYSASRHQVFREEFFSIGDSIMCFISLFFRVLSVSCRRVMRDFSPFITAFFFPFHGTLTLIFLSPVRRPFSPRFCEERNLLLWTPSS